jgi:ribosomal 50S subunit-recycling heat shock protein
VQINGQVAKAGREIAIADILTVNYPSRILKVRVEQVPERAVSKKDAASLYTLLEETRTPDDDW